MALHVRKNDVVEIISGDHRGARGKVLRVEPKRRLVVVEGINLVFRHVRPTRKNPQGGRVQKEAPIPLAKVLPVDPAKGRGSRVRYEVDRGADGRVAGKRRVTVKGGRLHTMTGAGRTNK